MISIVVPALNEEKNIREAVRNILESANEAGGVPVEIMIVNDGSSDKTGEIGDELARLHPCIRAVHHASTTGVALSVKEAIQAAEYPRFISLPGSNDVSKELLGQLFAKHAAADVVLSHYVNPEKRVWYRRMLSALFGRIYGGTFDLSIRCFTGPAIYPTERLRNFTLRSYGFSIFPEMTIKSILSGCSYIEIPGHMLQSSKKSTAVSLRSLAEVVTVYLRLVWEIKITGEHGAFHCPGRRAASKGLRQRSAKEKNEFGS